MNNNILIKIVVKNRSSDLKELASHQVDGHNSYGHGGGNNAGLAFFRHAETTALEVALFDNPAWGLGGGVKLDGKQNNNKKKNNSVQLILEGEDQQPLWVVIPSELKF